MKSSRLKFFLEKETKLKDLKIPQNVCFKQKLSNNKGIYYNNLVKISLVFHIRMFIEIFPEGTFY